MNNSGLESVVGSQKKKYRLTLSVRDERATTTSEIESDDFGDVTAFVDYIKQRMRREQRKVRQGRRAA